MNRKSLIICLSAIGAMAFILRTVYPFNSVFGASFVSYLETDAYWTMSTAKNLAALPFWESIPNMVYHSHLFPWLIAVFSHVAPIELVGAWLPPVLAVGTVIVVYLIGAELFDFKIGLLAAAFVAVIPSEFLHRSLLGFTDHHVMEALLMALVVYFLIKVIKYGRNKDIVFAGISLFFYFTNWPAGIYLLVVVLILFGAVALFQSPRRFKTVALVASAAVIGLVLFLPLGGYSRLLFLIPGQEVQIASQTTGEIVQTVFASPGTRTISELMPLLYPYGRFSLAVVFTNLHLFALTFLAGIPFLWVYRKDKAIIIFAIWTLVMLVITLNERRFLYYLTLNIGILSALAVMEIAKRLKGKHLQNALILALPLLVISLPLAKSMGQAQTFKMSEDWHSALVWLKEQPGDGFVSAWGDYGHWIKYVSGKQPSYFPGPGGDLVARLFLSTDDAEAKKLLDAMGTDYLIVDELTLVRKYQALVVYAGGDISPHSAGLAGRLYYQNRVPDFLKMIYENGSLRIFQYLK